MKKKVLFFACFLLIGLVMLTSCDPVYPPGNLKVKKIDSLLQGSSADIEIIYPNIGGSIVLDWKEQSVEIISGADIVAVSDFTITGLKSGIALIRVSATTIISDEASKEGYKERVYSTEIEVEVK